MLVRGQSRCRILSLLLLSCCPSIIAQEHSEGQSKASFAHSIVAQHDEQQVCEIWLKMLDRWNAHDIEGYLKVYWKSPELLVVVDAEQFNGWQQLHDSYIKGYPDREAMGYMLSRHIQVKLLRPDLALALTWWSISFSSSEQGSVGNTTINLQKFGDEWVVIAAHSSTGGM